MVKHTNGIGILVFLVAVVSLRPALAQPGDDGAFDYGWQINDGVLEYIIQIRPEQLSQMQAPNPMEKESVMPIELVGRARRIAVRVGTARLPRTPTLQEIERTIPRYSNANDVISALGPGRISDVESGSVVNVQDPGIPSLPPSFGQAGQSSLPPYNNLADQAAAASANLMDRAKSQAESQAAQDFINSARGANPAMPPTLPGTTQNPMALPGTNKYADTAPARTTPYNGAAQGAANDVGGFSSNLQTGTNATNGTTYDPRMPLASDRNAGPPAMNQPRSNGPAGFGANGYPASNRDPYGMAGSNGQTGRAEDGWQGTGSGFGGGYGNENFTNIPANNPPQYGYPQEAPPTTRPFGPRDSLVSNQLNAGGGQSASDKTPEESEGSKAASANGNSTGTAVSQVKKTGDVLMQMFFLVSLVANVYLVFLIRKLLTRYRSLLTTVRSQTA